MESRWEDPPQHSGGGLHMAMPRLTPIVKLLLIGNVGMFLLTMIGAYDPGQSGGGTMWRVITQGLGLSPDVWRSWFPLVPFWQLVTYGFLHGGLGHILGNLLFLYFLGTMLEGVLGSRRFAVVYFAGLIVAGVCQLGVGLLRSESAVIMGASGAVLTIVVAMATLRPQQRIIFILFPITLKTLAILYVSFDAFTAIMDLKGAHSGVASFAHLAGAAFGFLAVRRGWIWKDPLEAFHGWRSEREGARQVEDQAALDELLAKINREGISSLSSRERAFLKRASKR